VAGSSITRSDFFFQGSQPSYLALLSKNSLPKKSKVLIFVFSTFHVPWYFADYHQKLFHPYTVQNFWTRILQSCNASLITEQLATNAENNHLPWNTQIIVNKLVTIWQCPFVIHNRRRLIIFIFWKIIQFSLLSPSLTKLCCTQLLQNINHHQGHDSQRWM